MSTTLSPPNYRRYSGLGPRPNESDCLPAYSRRDTLACPHPRREPTEHTFSLQDGRHTWATLNLRSSAKSSRSLPTFYEKENINGFLNIDADKTDSIHSVSAVVTGRVANSWGGSQDLLFLNIVVPIWSRSPDQPRAPSPSEGANGSKLRGKCSWPLSIPIPKESTVKGQTYRLPETFNERGFDVFVQYELTIKITRGKLKSDAQLSTFFGYVPSTRPEAPSPLRQLAYQENSALPGPLVDSEGWHSLKPAHVRGTLFKSKKVDAKLSLFLAKPLSYTRGSVIPCSLIIESKDTQLLDLLSAPEAVPLRLRRCVQHYSKSAAPPQAFASANHGWNKAATDVGSAVWWRAPHDSKHVRYLEGEIRLAKDLKPSCCVGNFGITYNILLNSLQIPGFVMNSSEVLFYEHVEIATKFARGPRPHAYSPPGYAHDTSIRQPRLDSSNVALYPGAVVSPLLSH